MGDQTAWARIDYRSDGVYLVVRPGAPAPAMAQAITELIQKGVQGVDFAAIQAAWTAADGTPSRIAPPMGGSTTSANALDPFLRAEERNGEVFLTIMPGATVLSERELIAWLNKRDYSALDLDLVRRALGGPRGLEYPITRSQVAQEKRPEPKLTDAKTALVLETDPAYRSRLEDGLKKRGLNVRMVQYPEAALFEVRQRSIDLILVAHPFGRHDGIGLAQTLRTDPRAAETAMVAMCQQPTRELVRRALECGVNEIVVRPWAPSVLATKLESALRRVGKRLPGVSTEAQAAEGGAAPSEDVKTLGKIDVQKMVAAVGRLHALPGVVERVLSVTADPDTGAKQLASCIQGDPSAAAVVLKVANSAMYGSASKIANVSDAVVRIGFLQTKSLVLGMSVVKLLGSTMKTAGFDRVLFWRHSIAVAIIAKLIAEHVRLVDGEVAFIAGLLHDIGKLMLDEFVPVEFSEVVKMAIECRVPMVEAEQSVLQTSHVDVGAAVLAVWRIPEVVIGAVKSHHPPKVEAGGPPVETSLLSDVVFAANRLAKAIGHGNGGDLMVEEVPDAVWLRLNLGAGLPDHFWRRFRTEAERFEQLMGFEATPLPEFGASGKAVYVVDGHAPCVSLLSLALSSAGYLVEIGAVSGAPIAAVARSDSPEAYAATRGGWAAVPTLARVRQVGILPRGNAVPAGIVALTEPFDRSLLIEQVAGPQAGA